MGWADYPPPSSVSLSKPPEFLPAIAVLMPKALAPTKDKSKIARATIFGEIFFILFVVSYCFNHYNFQMKGYKEQKASILSRKLLFL